jgi:hypothetical protein
MPVSFIVFRSGSTGAPRILLFDNDPRVTLEVIPPNASSNVWTLQMVFLLVNG